LLLPPLLLKSVGLAFGIIVAGLPLPSLAQERQVQMALQRTPAYRNGKGESYLRKHSKAYLKAFAIFL
jgi:hypothetical protein